MSQISAKWVSFVQVASLVAFFCAAHFIFRKRNSRIPQKITQSSGRWKKFPYRHLVDKTKLGSPGKIKKIADYHVALNYSGKPVVYYLVYWEVSEIFNMKHELGIEVNRMESILPEKFELPVGLNMTNYKLL